MMFFSRHVERLALMFLPILSAAAVIRVPSQAPTIQMALENISDGDTILVAIGTYAEALLAPPLHFVLKGDVLPDSGEYPRPIIDPSSLHNSDSLACLVLPEQSSTVLEDMEFRNGAAMYPHWIWWPGGIKSDGGSLTVRHCIFDSTYHAIYHFAPLGQDIVDSLKECVFRNMQSWGVMQTDYPVVATNCDFTGGDAIGLCGAGLHSRISDCHFGPCAGVSLMVYGDNSSVKECVFGPTTIPSSGGLLSIGHCVQNMVVQDNVFADNSGITAVVIVSALAPNSFLVEGNQFLNNSVRDSGTCIDVDTESSGHPENGGSFQNNRFVNCFGRLTGSNIVSSNGTIDVTRNRFVEDADDPDHLTEILVYAGNGVHLRENIFLHTGWALRSDTIPVDAEFNYWGDSTGPYNATDNPFGHGDTIVGNVNFTPWYPDTSFLEEARRIPAPMPDHFALQVFPNPFNSSVTLTLIPQAAMIIRVELFDILGRRLRQVWSGPVAGEKRVLMSADELSSGIYFVRVWQVIGNRPLALQKVVLMK